MKVVEETRSYIVRDNYSIFQVARSICEAVSCCDEESVRSKVSMSNVVSHLIV